MFKLLIGGAIAMGFFLVYAALQRVPLFAVTAMPLTALDRLVGFHPHATLFYLTLWFYIPIAPWLADSRRDLRAYAAAMTAMCVVGLLVFFLWPTAVPRPAADVGQPAAFRFVALVDRPLNACPSLHAAFAVFCGLCNHWTLRRLGGRRWLHAANWCWCLAILYGTLATRQHVAIDVYCGGALGVCAYWVFLWRIDAKAEEDR